jgi:hypothetical protein
MRKPETAGEVDQKMAVKTLGMKAQAKRRAKDGQAEQRESSAETEKAAIAAAPPAPDDRLSGSASGGRKSFKI